MASRFEADLKRFSQRVRRDHVDVINKIGLDLNSRIVRKTPRDTGRAAGAWFFTGAELSNPIALIINNVAYIQRLNSGWSKQAPNGMVEVSIAEIQEIYR